jgi:predicted TIM-barrel fold metal-dependent hydrolase
MVVDAFVQVGKSIHGYEQTPEDLISSMERYGIDYSVICPVQPFTYHLEPENDYIADVVRNFQKHFIGFCRVDPRQGDRAISEVERSVKELDLKGVFLHPWEEGYRTNADFVIPIVKRATELGVTVMIATGYPWVSHALQVANLAEKVPEAKIIMTHGGQINISGLAQADAALALRSNKNIYMETSGVYRQDFIEEAIEEFGADRVLFGSNSPKMHQGFEFDRALSATKNNSKQEMVLGKSVAQLLNLV